MMKQLDISIVVPIYNASKYLNKCLDSLVNQTKKELEFILINDGSTDNSEDIIKSYNDSRIKYFKRSNHGIGNTRNFGINKASGKYIMFLDSDDYLEYDACEVLYKKINTDKLDLVVSDFYRVVNDSKIEEHINNFKNTSLKDNPDLLLDVNLAPWKKIYSSNLIKNNNIKFIENLKYEDAPFVTLSLLKANKIGKVDKPLINYIIHEKSETTVRDERIFDIIKIVDIIRSYFKNYSWSKEAVDTLTIKILVNYNIQQRVIKDKDTRNRFIDETFTYFEKNIPNYRQNIYFKERSVLKSFIEKNKAINKLYCTLYIKLMKCF